MELKNRFKALDIFRGLTIFLMIVVNTPGDWGSTFSTLLHASWHGFTPTDLVFPSFLFAVGASFAFVKKRWTDTDFQQVFTKIFKRTIIIFLLGYTLYWFPFVKWSEAGELVFKPWSETRIPGVLQRIALCYFLGAVLIYFLSKRQLIIASVSILLSYWAILFFFGDYTLEGNAARSLDIWLLGENHMYKGEGLAFDPEGLLSTFPAVINVVGGYLAADYFITKGINYESLSKVLLAAMGCLVVAYAWDLTFPINKKIWTSSYVFLTIGMDLMLLGVIVYWVDIKNPGLKLGFFEVFGKNPLFIYLISGYVVVLMFLIRINGQSLYGYIYQNGFKWIGPYFGSLAFAMTFTLLLWLLARWLDKKKIYIKV